MAPPKTTLAMMQAAVDAFALHGNQTHAARALGLSRAAFQSRLARAKSEGLAPHNPAPQAAELPPPDLSFDERLEYMKNRNATRIAHARAQSWQQVTIPTHGPYGLCFFGDPHLDDPFCNIHLLEEHATICRDTPGLYGINGGDSVNNWVGRLERLYADQSTTASEGWELVEWFMNGLGIRWALWLLGNHDVWNHGLRLFQEMNVQRILMRDWDARVTLASPDGNCLLWARHDFKGTSIYNELHGLKRAAMFSANADIYAAFHRHTWGTQNGEGENGRRFCLVRAKGYKEVDDYAIKSGFNQQVGGQSVVVVVQPQGLNPPIVHAFDDVRTGADFLTFLRGKEDL